MLLEHDRVLRDKEVYSSLLQHCTYEKTSLRVVFKS